MALDPVGSPDAIVADARANGILWVNSAVRGATSLVRLRSSMRTEFLSRFRIGNELNTFVVGGGATLCAG